MNNGIEMRRVIFTDIDGVLHPVDAAQIEWEGSEWRAVGKNLFCWAPLLWELIASCPVDLVIHSTWRFSYSPDELRSFFPEAIRDRIVGVTGMFSRHESIIQYAEKIGLNDFLVLDDMPEEFPTGWAPLVCCKGDLGLSDETVRQRILTFIDNDLNPDTPRGAA